MVGCKKYKKEFEILALLILILIINSTFQINIYKYFSKNSSMEKDFSESLKPSYYTIGSIFIEDDNPARDWDHFASSYLWCSGSGAENDPYIINNVYIDAGGAEGVGYCITILDSDVYFIIQNSLLNNSLYGIDLDDTNNGIIQNNTISSHSGSGIKCGYSDNITIHHNTIVNNDGGIYIQSFCDNVIITNNTISNSQDYGLYVSYADDGMITNNLLIDNGDEGINLYDCDRYNISHNIIRNSGNEGIRLSSSDDNTIYNNSAISNGVGIHIGGTMNQVLNNSLYSNTEGLRVYGGGHEVSYNNVSLNANRGIQISSVNSKFYENIANENTQGIYLTGSGNNITGNDVNDNLQNGIQIQGSINKIERNNIEANSYSGILMQNANNNSIDQNLIRHNGLFGIFLDGVSSNPCYYNIISRNTIAENSDDGVISVDCHSNTYLENNITNHPTRNGIELQDAEDNIVRGNRFYNNLNGIRCLTAYDNIFERNNFTENNANGVYLEAFCSRNNFSGNEFNNNFYTGINIDRDYMWWNPLAYTSGSNLIYNNSFIGNTLHAFSNSTYDFWNSSTIGNYWDDFLTGVDINDDGISEIPYNVSIIPFTQDFLPIYDDGDDPAPPIISIVSPIDNQIMGISSPSFQILTSGLHVNTTWYEIDGGSVNYTISGNSGKINQGLWDEFGNGTVTIRFYVNDSLGYGTSDEITVRKDINQPNLVINTPISDTLYDNIAPIFNVELSDPNLDTSWYSLDGGLTNIIFTTNSSINQTLWESTPDGQVEIQFYVNDTAANLIFDSVITNKDTYSPVISINSPNPSDLFGNSTIDFNVEVFDLNLEKMWYTIVGSLTNITFISNGTIDTTLWNNFGSGDLTLAFYANDTLGRISANNVTISKDIDPPSITISNPTSGEIFYVTPPEFEIVVNDPHLELVWFTIDGGLTNINITQYTSYIDQNIWDAAPQGDITIKFYARDSLGNIAFSEVVVSKESVTQPPSDPEIPGYMPLILLVMISVTSIILFLRQRKKLKIL